MKFSIPFIPLQTRLRATWLLTPGFFLPALLSLSLPAYCQDKPHHSSWWIGIAGGANFNSYHGFTSALNADITASPAFEKGHGVGSYFAALLEYHPEGSIWGLRLQQGPDNRKATFNAGGNRLKAKISYFSIEPGILLMPLKSQFYFYAGPRLGLLSSTSFTYKEPNSPEYPQKHIDYPAYIKNIDKITASMHVGAGYNFEVSQGKDKRKLIMSPFFTYLPSLNKNLRTIETLKLNTLRAGIILKVGLGSGHR